MDEEEFWEEPEHHEYVEIAEIFPANPIYDKPAAKETKPQLRIELVKNEITTKEPVRPVMKKFSEPDEEAPEEELATNNTSSAFDSFFPGCKCLYRRYNNITLNRYKFANYFASCFIERRFLQQNKQELRTLKQLVALVPHDDTNIIEVGNRDIQFDSDFESGNLFAVYKRLPTEYDLVLQNDTNSRGNTQWFYFTISNAPLNVELTFNIVNLMKSDSLFNYGMQPVVLSEMRLKKNKESWQRLGKVVGYTRNTVRRENSRRYYYTLTFKLTSKIAGDKLHIAHCFPYTYTMLEEFIKTLIKTHTRKGLKLERATIGKSVGGLPIEVLSLSQPNDILEHQKKIIVVMARQHPGETQGSFVCEGLTNYLLSRSKEACFLRRYFIVKIIPMVNPDGVVMGNYRTNLSGCDLNRKWDTADRRGVFPEVACIKQYIADLNRSKRVKVVLDLHGHSKKLGSFFYGNPYPQQPEYVRGFAYMCSKLSDKVSFEDCTFTIQEEKKRAARVYLSLAHQITHIYTFQSSFFGYVKDGSKRVAFTVDDFRQLGVTLVNGLHAFLAYDIAQEQKQPILSTETSLYQKCLTDLRNDPNLISLGDHKESGSESNPEEFEIDLADLTVPKEEQVRDQKPQKGGISAKKLKDPQSPNDDTRRQHCSVQKVTASNPVSRHSNRNILGHTKHRKLKVLEISRVNSMLPDRYHLGLQPFNTSHIISSKQAEQPVQFERSTLHNKSMRTFARFTRHTQTNLLRKEDWAGFCERDLYKEGVLPTSCNPFSTNYRNFQIKYVSLTTGKCKNNLMLKLDFLARPPESLVKTGARTCSTQTQTVLTNVNAAPPLTNRSNLLAENDAPAISVDESLQSVRLSLRKDTPEPFNEVIRKGLAKPQSFTAEPPLKIGRSDQCLFRKPTASEITQSLVYDKPLIIRKKEIMSQRRCSASKESSQQP